MDMPTLDSERLNPEFRTKDLNEAAFILCKGARLLRLEKDEMTNDFYFVFVGRNCEDLANQFWAREGSVPAKDYSDSLRTLKDRLFARGR